MTRMRWVRDPDLPFRWVSGCGRFEVGGPLFVGTATYTRLFDRLYQREYPCRTLASAKAAARNRRRLAPPEEQTPCP